jgi:hypothetical protein
VFFTKGNLAKQDKEQFFLALIRNAARVMHLNQQRINKASLQENVSAIMFVPTRSKVRQIYSQQLPR